MKISFIAMCLFPGIIIGISGCTGNGKGEDAIEDRDAMDPDMDAADAPAEEIPVDHVEDLLLEPDVAEVPVEDATVDDDSPDMPELPPSLVWVSIPAGTFQMGCSPGDTECMATEEPPHVVAVSSFEILETEVTQAQYEAVMGSNPSYFSGCLECPVELVSWHSARSFCEAIGGRLPSEAEWEYAARAGTTTRFYCGDDSSCADGIAWHFFNASLETHPVGYKIPNAFGLYDMLGNVWEWVEDCWHEDYTGAPTTGQPWVFNDCEMGVTRGGSYGKLPQSLRVSIRYRLDYDLGEREIGFRCSR
jgi:formylglycine-generating enzyme required for sulfatase activity